MNAKHSLSRSLAVMSTVVTLASGVALTAAPSTARAETGNQIIKDFFSAFMDYTDDGTFMDYIDDACTPSLMSRQAGADACAAMSSALRDAAAPSDVPTALPSTPETNIIMRDGGVCDPIRHMGC